MRLIIIICIISEFCSAQVQFQIRRINPCNTESQPEREQYYLSDSIYCDVVYDNLDSEIITLPKTGKYYVTRISEPEVEPYQVELDEGLTVETVKDPRIMERYINVIEPYYEYQVCGNAANGYHEDFYNDGKLKIRGTFKQGFVKDSIAIYYPNGQLEIKTEYKRDGVHTVSYDTCGIKLNYYWSEKGSYMIYRSRRFIKYYTDGSIKSNISDINNIVKIKQYYPDGKLQVMQNKKSRQEYYKSGVLKKKYIWKSKVDNGEFIINIKVKEYDEDGICIGEYIDEDYSNYPQPTFAFQDNDLWTPN